MHLKGLLQVSDFDLRLLRVFRTVAQVGSFSAAEGVLGITRSAISLHMSDLEKRLGGIRLCQRGRAGFALTEEGRQVLRASETLMAAVENFRSEVNQLHSSLRGDLNIGLMNSLISQPHMHITSALRTLRQNSDAVRVHISMSTPGEIERGLLEGRLHMGVLPETNALSGLEYRTLYAEPYFLYCSWEHPLFRAAQKGTVAPADVRAAAAIAPAYRMSSEAIAQHQDLNCVATASDREGIAFLILTGEYIGFLPEHVAARWVEKGQMIAVDPQQRQFTIPLSLAMRKDRHAHAIVDYFLSALDSVAQN